MIVWMILIQALYLTSWKRVCSNHYHPYALLFQSNKQIINIKPKPPCPLLEIFFDSSICVFAACSSNWQLQTLILVSPLCWLHDPQRDKHVYAFYSSTRARFVCFVNKAYGCFDLWFVHLCVLRVEEDLMSQRASVRSQVKEYLFLLCIV